MTFVMKALPLNWWGCGQRTLELFHPKGYPGAFGLLPWPCTGHPRGKPERDPLWAGSSNQTHYAPNKSCGSNLALAAAAEVGSVL
jgi:hypothetical protein